MSYTEPSGYFFSKLWKKVKPFVGVIAGVIASAYCGPCSASIWAPAGTGAAIGAGSAAINGGNILKGAEIDVDQNVKDAQKLGDELDIMGFIKNVETGGIWDYKNNEDLVGNFSGSLLDEFGNVHFGIVSHAAGFNLEGTMYGAGLYQVNIQGGGNSDHLLDATALMSLTAGGYMLSDAYSRQITNQGFTWGDNTGDAINIMNGWTYGESVYGE